MNTALVWAKRLHQLPHHTQVPPSGGNELSQAGEVVDLMLDRCFCNVLVSVIKGWSSPIHSKSKVNSQLKQISACV